MIALFDIIAHIARARLPLGLEVPLWICKTRQQKPTRQTCFMLLKPLAMHDTVFANTGLSPFVNTGNILLQQTTQISLHLSQRNTFNPHISPGKVFFKSRSGWHSLMRGKDSETQNFYRIRSFFLFQCFFPYPASRTPPSWWNIWSH